jgi:peptidoglycan hydrolase CwlO-like protein|tara:strand:- start:2432 stop:2845 length:414 start_codon:yes stop_codon:yes gene_type:complete
MEEKLSSMSHRDWFVKRLAKSLNIDISIVDEVIKHQFESVVNAAQKNKSVEISGWGTLKWNDKAAQRRLDSMDAQIRAIRNKIASSKSELKIQRWNDVIDEMLLKHKILINRINELNADLRRLEKQAAPRRKTKGTD